MFTQGFVVSGASLKLLKIGEQGVVSRFKHTDHHVVQQLQTLGIVPGTPITVEQRSPHFMVKVGCDHLTLTEDIIHAIYVRLPATRPDIVKQR